MLSQNSQIAINDTLNRKFLKHIVSQNRTVSFESPHLTIHTQSILKSVF